jgi:hypothetical protein
LTTLAVIALAGGLMMAPSHAIAAETAPCNSCGRDVDGGYRFCPFDGNRIEPAGCGSCGRALEPTWRFCPWDGTPTQREARPAAPETPGATAPPHDADAPPPTRENKRGHKNPYDTVDSLFSAIEQRDERRLRLLYDWARFLPPGEDKETTEEREQRIADYVERLLARVRPTLDGTQRRVTDMKLNRTEATLTVMLRRADTRAVVQEYRFTLSDSAQGWRITAIKP